jgi:uncharacterized protein
MVGNIALTHIIDKLKLKQIGYIKSPETPHVILVHKNRPSQPIRLYGGSGIIAVLSELPVHSNSSDELNKKLMAWFVKKGVGTIYLLGGYPAPEKKDNKTSRVYGIPSGAEGEKIIKKLKLNPVREGAVFGEEGLLLLDAMEQKQKALYLMADSFPGFPDPSAAAKIIKVLNKILGKNIKTASLETKGEKIKKSFDDLMTQTMQLLKDQKQVDAIDKDALPMYR